MSKHLKFAVTVALASAFACHASPVTVDMQFSFGWSGNRSNTGEIVATDFNGDGLLTVNEVTSVIETYSGHSSVSQLYDIGTIDIAAKTWTPNGVSWVGFPSTAYMTFDSRLWSCSTYNNCGATITSFAETGATVPEPGSLALAGLALLGVGLVHRRHKN